MPLPARPSRITAASVLCAAVVALWPADLSAQRRGRAIRGRTTAVVVAAPLYVGYGYHSPFWSGHRGFSPHWWQAPYYPRYPYSRSLGSARLKVVPRNAEVHVDGYFVGTVDDFEGFFQRLDVPVGGHELTIYLEGYRTFTEKVYFRPGATLDIEHELQPLGPGETAGARPEPAADAPRGASDEPRRPHDPPRRPRDGARGRGDETRRASGFGSLAIRVQPSDAAILVNGEEWSASEGAGPIVIELPVAHTRSRSDATVTRRSGGRSPSVRERPCR